MLVACRLAGLSALGGHYAGVKSRAMLGEAQRCRNAPMRGKADIWSVELQPFGAKRLTVMMGGAGTRAAFPDSGPVSHPTGPSRSRPSRWRQSVCQS